MAAGVLWILDSSINITMEPFRAFVADNLNEKQRSFGFAMQSMFIGLASFIAGYLPQLLANWFDVSRDKINGSIPQNILMSFQIHEPIMEKLNFFYILNFKLHERTTRDNIQADSR
jgi:maltose/moltooligosaccharide transporter